MELGSTVTKYSSKPDLYGNIASESIVFPIGEKRVFFRKESYSIPWMDHVTAGYGPMVDHGHLNPLRLNWKEIQNLG
jgi:hypothetical protein